jgi:hypothetical protein
MAAARESRKEQVLWQFVQVGEERPGASSGVALQTSNGGNMNSALLRRRGTVLFAALSAHGNVIGNGMPNIFPLAAESTRKRQ